MQCISYEKKVLISLVFVMTLSQYAQYMSDNMYVCVCVRYGCHFSLCVFFLIRCIKMKAVNQAHWASFMLIMDFDLCLYAVYYLKQLLHSTYDDNHDGGGGGGGDDDTIRYDLLFKIFKKKTTHNNVDVVCIVRMKYDLIEAYKRSRENETIRYMMSLKCILYDPIHIEWPNVDCTCFVPCVCGYFLFFSSLLFIIIIIIIMNLHWSSCLSFHSNIYEQFYSVGSAISIQSVARNAIFILKGYILTLMVISMQKQNK